MASVRALVLFSLCLTIQLSRPSMAADQAVKLQHCEIDKETNSLIFCKVQMADGSVIALVPFELPDESENLYYMVANKRVSADQRRKSHLRGNIRY